MTNQYKLTVYSNGSNAVFLITYEAGKFKKLEKRSGRLASQEQYSKLMFLVPELEQVILLLRNEYTPERVTWDLVEKSNAATLVRSLTDEYNKWYTDRNGIKPKLNGTEVNALKQIIAYLKQQASTEEEVKAVFNSVLTNWENYSTYYQGQMELRQINHNLNTLLRLLKHGDKSNNPRKQAESVSDDLRGRFKET